MGRNTVFNFSISRYEKASDASIYVRVGPYNPFLIALGPTKIAEIIAKAAQ